MKQKLEKFYVFVLIVKIIFTVALVAIYPNSFLAPDSSSYIVPASKFWLELSFINDSGHEIFRTPGYPMFLAPAFFISIPVLYYAAFFQLILVCFCAYWIYKITICVSQNKTAGHLAAFFTLLSPEITLSQHAILSEILFTSFLTYSCYLLLCWYRSEKSILFVVAFLFITIATFVRPTSLYLPYVLGLVIIYYLLFSDTIHKKFMTFILILLMLTSHTIAVNFWTERNFSVSGAREFATGQSVLMNEYIAAAIVARGDNRKWEGVKKEFSDAYYATPPEQRKKFASDVFLSSVKKHPTESLIIFVRGFLDNAASPGFGLWIDFFDEKKVNQGIRHEFHQRTFNDFVLYLITEGKVLFLVAVLGAGYILVLWASFLFGIAITRFTLPVVLLLATIGYVLVVSSGAQSYARFRVPVMPFILVFASIGLTVFFNKKS